MQQKTSNFKFIQLPLFYLLAIMFGVFSGMSDIHLLHDLGGCISELFIRIFKCISLPIIALSIIVTLASYNAEDALQRVWKRTIFYTLMTTFIAASVSAALYLLIRPVNLSATKVTMAASRMHTGEYFKHLSNLIPTNIFAPFLEHQVMGVLLMGFIIGFAIRQIPDNESRSTLTHFFKGAHGIFMVITRWVVEVIPLALYGFITTTVIQLREGMDLKGLGGYLAIVVFANLIQGFMILPAWLKLNRIQPFDTLRKMLPALSLAFFSKSSAATLPITISTAEKNLNINPKISRFVLPLCTSLNMNGCAAFIFATVIYVMQNNGFDVTVGTIGLWILVATITAVGNAGVPMGCFFLSASLLSSMNIPINLLGVILPFYSLIDMLETAINVWSDACVATVVNQKEIMDAESVARVSFKEEAIVLL